MKNWWNSLSKEKRDQLKAGTFLCFLFFVGIPFFVLAIMRANDTGPGKITYDVKEGKIVESLSFYKWLKNNPLHEDKYVFIAEEIIITDIVANTAYRAKLYIRPKNQTVRKFLTKERLTTHQAYDELYEAISSCVNQVEMQSYREQNLAGAPSITVRAMSLSASYMDLYCSIPARFGYEWFDKLEIVQCNGDLPLDNTRKNDCLNSVRMAHYP